LKEIARVERTEREKYHKQNGKEFKEQKTAILLLPLSEGSERNIEIKKVRKEEISNGTT
jgi:hypothetical protein